MPAHLRVCCVRAQHEPCSQCLGLRCESCLREACGAVGIACSPRASGLGCQKRGPFQRPNPQQSSCPLLSEAHMDLTTAIQIHLATRRRRCGVSCAARSQRQVCVALLCLRAFSRVSTRPKPKSQRRPQPNTENKDPKSAAQPIVFSSPEQNTRSLGDSTV